MRSVEFKMSCWCGVSGYSYCLCSCEECRIEGVFYSAVCGTCIRNNYLENQLAFIT